MLDNIESQQNSGQKDRQQPLRSQPLPGPESKQPSDSTRPSFDSTTPRQSSNVADSGVGWGENAEPDDWGWGFDNPTLAAATGSYKDNSQRSSNGPQPADSRQQADIGQPASSADRSKQGAPQPDEDWDDQLADDGDSAEPSPDVTALSRIEAVRCNTALHCNAPHANVATSQSCTGLHRHNACAASVIPAILASTFASFTGRLICGKLHQELSLLTTG